ncbi:phage tail tape measure protein, partial [Nocardia sp. CNY236]|uniref:phage tail tape measure protein n=1 Tax=Nocardia sp. CNY236 TaxID=1169152 RepID=UPI00048A5542
MSTEQEAAEQEAAEAGAAAAASFSDVFQSALSEIRGTFGEALMQGIDDATGQAAGAASGAAADAATVLEAGLRQAFSNAASGAKEVLQNSLQQAFDDATGILQSSFVDAVHDAATGGGEAGMILAEGFTLAVTTGMRGLADKVGLGGVVDHMIAVGQGFEGALSTIGEVSGATEEQLEQVAVRAKELGSDAGVVNTSVNDAAAAMAGLAVSGFSVEESMSAARSALQLAAAAHLDASEAAAVQTDVLKAFGLGAESARLAADVLAGSSNRLGIGVSAIGQELSESGAVAGQLGMTMADTAAALVAFGEAEVPVSEVDSVLGSVLSAFTTDSKEANEAIERLGLTLGEIPAEFVGLPALFDQLRTAQLRNGDAAYTSHLSALFGADAMKALSAAAEQGSAGIQSISNEISKQGNASEFAGQQTNQSSEFLKSFNDVVLEVSQGIGTLSATLADLIASGFDAVVNAGKSVIGFFQEHLGVVKVVAAGLATLLLPGLIRLGAELSVVKAKIIATSIADKAAALAKNLYTIATKGAAAAMKLLNTAINASPLGRLLTILLAVGGAVFAFFTQTETGKQIWDAVWSGIQSAFSATWEFLRPLWETFTGWLSNAGNALMWLWEGVVQPVMMWIGDA